MKGTTMNDTTKQFFTVERAYLAPIFQHVTVEAETPADAAREALAVESWESSETDYDSSRAVYIDGIWPGEDASYSVPSLAVPVEYRNPEIAKAEALDSIVREMIFGDGDDASLQRVIDLCNSAKDRFGIERRGPSPAEAIAGMEEALGGPQATPERVAAVEDRLAAGGTAAEVGEFVTVNVAPVLTSPAASLVVLLDNAIAECSAGVVYFPMERRVDLLLQTVRDLAAMVDMMAVRKAR